jgi:hypothetical protein
MKHGVYTAFGQYMCCVYCKQMGILWLSIPFDIAYRLIFKKWYNSCDNCCLYKQENK